MGLMSELDQRYFYWLLDLCIGKYCDFNSIAMSVNNMTIAFWLK